MATIQELTGGLGVDYTIETTAVPALLRQAVDCLNQGGTCGLIDLYQQGRFPFDRLVRTYDFADIEKAVHDAETGEVFKPVLTFDGFE